MDLYLCQQFIWTLLFVLVVDGGATERCSASRGTSFILSVASHRNLTGHWIVTVDSVREDPRQPSAPNSPVEVAVDIAQHTATCEDRETVQLAATAVVNAVPTVQGVTETPTIATSEDHVTPDTSDMTPDVPETTSREIPTIATSEDHVTPDTSDMTPDVSETTSRAVPTAGYELVSGFGYYKMHTEAVMWEQTREKCVQEGAHLIIINSKQEAEVFKTLFKQHQSKIQGSHDRCCSHAGFDDMVTEGKYITVLGEPLSNSGYMVWHGSAWHGKERNCGFIYGSTAQLDIHNCSMKFAFICCEISAQ